VTSVLRRFSQRDFILILSLSVFAFTALVFTFFVMPKLKAYLAVQKTETAMTMLVDNGDLLDTQVTAVSEDIDALRQRLHGDMASLPLKQIESHVVGKLQQISWQNNIQLVGIEPSAGETIETFHEILFEVSLAGDYMDMYQWLREVTDELGFVLIKEYAMRPADNRAEDPRLSVQLTMATYRALN
jgi:Tfp pilus assembly protein PilO